MLVEPEGEINFGFIVRLCKNFEVDELYVVRPRIDVFSDEVRRFAAHGADYLDSGRVRIVNELDEALKGYSLSACTSAIIVGEGDMVRRAVELSEFVEIASRYSSVAVVFGRESVGLTREELSKCDLLVHIAASPSYPTLNLSHAVAIVLYELFKRSRRTSFEEKIGKASEEDLRILDRYIDMLCNIVGSDERQRREMSLALKRFIRRVALTRTEVGLLSTLFRRVAQKMIEQYSRNGFKTQSADR